MATYCNYIATFKYSLSPVDLSHTVISVKIDGVNYPAILGVDIIEPGTGTVLGAKKYYVSAGFIIYNTITYNVGDIFQTDNGLTAISGTGTYNEVTGYKIFPQNDSFEAWLNGLGFGVFYFDYQPNCIIISNYQSIAAITQFDTLAQSIKTFVTVGKQSNTDDYRMLTLDTDAFQFGASPSPFVNIIWIAEEDTDTLDGFIIENGAVNQHDLFKIGFIDLSLMAAPLTTPRLAFWDPTGRGLFVADQTNGEFAFIVTAAFDTLITIANTDSTTSGNPPDVAETLTGDTSGAQLVVTGSTLLTTTGYWNAIPPSQTKFIDGETVTGSASGPSFIQMTAPQPLVDLTTQASAANTPLTAAIVTAITNDGPDTYHKVIQIDRGPTIPTQAFSFWLSPNKITIINSVNPGVFTNNWWLSAGITGGQRKQISALSGGAKFLWDIVQLDSSGDKFAVTTGESLLIISNYNYLPYPIGWDLISETTPGGVIDLRSIAVVQIFIIVGDYANDRIMKFDLNGVLIDPNWILIEKPTKIIVRTIDNFFIVTYEGTAGSKTNVYSYDGILYKRFSSFEALDTFGYFLNVGLATIGTAAASTNNAIASIMPSNIEDVPVVQQNCYTSNPIDEQYCDYFATMDAATGSDLLFGVIIEGILYTPPQQYQLNEELNIETWLNTIDAIDNNANIQYTTSGNPTLVQLDTNTNWGYFIYLDLLNNQNQVYIPFVVQNCYIRVLGCTDPFASNYNALANYEDGSCKYSTPGNTGCTDSAAINYDPTASINDGTCLYEPLTDAFKIACCYGDMVYNISKKSLSGGKLDCCEVEKLNWLQFASKFMARYINPGTIYRQEYVYNTITAKWEIQDVTMVEADLCSTWLVKEKIRTDALEICHKCCEDDPLNDILT